jgi:PleD family two-component response regulator
MPHNSPPGIWSSRSFDKVNPPVAVLIVDDERATADALAAALAVDGFQTSVAESGYAALATPQAWTPHVVILDIEMPVCDGFAVAGAMRESHRFAIVPIIGFTSLDEADVVERGKKAQIDAFCRKGNSLHTLLKLIEYLAPVAS